MTGYIVRRVLATLPVLLVVALVVFALIRFAPGDPAAIIAGQEATQEEVEGIRRQLGLDRPLPVQLGIWFRDILRGDLGQSILSKHEVSELIVQRVVPTLSLAVLTEIFALAVAIPIGVLAAWKANSWIDRVVMVFATLGFSIPVFWLGFILIFFFAVMLGWVPPSGRYEWNSFVLPAITLGWFTVAANMRIVRSAMLDSLDTEYIKLARAKGVSESQIIWKHALKNAVIPPLTFMGITLGTLVTGSIVAETVFAWPGIGLLAFDALRQSDYSLLQGIVVFFAVMYLGTSLLVDILYAYLDPRIRYS